MLLFAETLEVLVDSASSVVCRMGLTAKCTFCREVPGFGTLVRSVVFATSDAFRQMVAVCFGVAILLTAMALD